MLKGKQRRKYLSLIKIHFGEGATSDDIHQSLLSIVI